MIDLRSDTVTQPCAAMRETMISAAVGDDVYGEDPTVNRLEAMMADMAGKEAALFVPSGTQSNLLALLGHCERGDEYIAGQEAHSYRFEGGGAAVLGGIQPQPLHFNKRGELDLDEVRSTIKPDDFHFARTRLLCLENTQAGKVLALPYIARFSEMAAELGLQTHLDGARLFNASVALSININEICRYFDTVSICLSKGLGAPVGSLLVGSNLFIRKARRLRKMVGGGMRQAGILAAAGIFALEHNIARLEQDHHHATHLASSLQNLPGFTLKEPPETNMVLLNMHDPLFRKLKKWLALHDIALSGQRWVCHKDVSGDDIEKIISLCKQFAKKEQEA